MLKLWFWCLVFWVDFGWEALRAVKPSFQQGLLLKPIIDLEGPSRFLPSASATMIQDWRVTRVNPSSVALISNASSPALRPHSPGKRKSVWF